MGTIVSDVYAKCNYDRLRIDKALGFWKKSDNNKNKKSENNVCSDWETFRVQKFTLSNL